MKPNIFRNGDHTTGAGGITRHRIDLDRMILTSQPFLQSFEGLQAFCGKNWLLNIMLVFPSSGILRR